jgi:adenine-specific DNA methylase
MNDHSGVIAIVVGKREEKSDMNDNAGEEYTAIMPFDSLYQASKKEASRKKPVFFIHKYFARRITANFRMALLGFMASRNDDVLKQFYEPSPNREDITVLDPFMGGGTTILEALRFGCKVIGNDLQPLSLFVTRALVEPMDTKAVDAAVRYLGRTVGKEIQNYYKTKCPCCGETADVMYTFHVKKVKTGGQCKEHRFFSTFILAYKKGEFTVVCPECGRVSKTTFKDGPFHCECGWELKDPHSSYVKNGVFTCPKCGESRVLSEYSNDPDSGYPFATDIVALEYYCPNCGAHDYKQPDYEDKALYEKAKADYCKYAESLPIPQQVIPAGYNTNQIINHGYRKFKELFNERQLLCLGLLLDAINGIDDKQTQLWLQLAFSGMLEMNTMFCRYQQNAYKICNIFFNHAYVPITMPVENCVWGTKLGTGTFIKTIKKIERGKKFNSNMYDISVVKNNEGRYDSVKNFNGDQVAATPVTVFDKVDGQHPLLRCSDSRDLSFIPDASVDLVLTDPPYGANVMYSELIDFFHVWNYKSTLADDLGFTEPLSPKSKEIVVNPVAGKDIQYYEEGLTKVLERCHDKVRDSGYLVFSFHDKHLESWLAVLESVCKGGFKLVKCYPVQSETRTGAHTSNKNSIGIDLMLVCKKISLNDAGGTVPGIDVKDASLQTMKYLCKTLDRLESVEAEITLPDMQNIAIAYYYSVLPTACLTDENWRRVAVKELKQTLRNVEGLSKDYTIADKRTGWWSELYKKKWDV